jgi:hypothetical protein
MLEASGVCLAALLTSDPFAIAQGDTNPFKMSIYILGGSLMGILFNVSYRDSEFS